MVEKNEAKANVEKLESKNREMAQQLETSNAAARESNEQASKELDNLKQLLEEKKTRIAQLEAENKESEGRKQVAKST